MKLSKVRIQHFRAISLLEFEVRDRLALVGKNGSGKTSVLRALNAFFNYRAERNAFRDKHHSFLPSSTAIVDLTFSDVPTSITLPRVSDSEDQLRVRFKYRTSPTWEVFADGAWTNRSNTLHKEIAEVVAFALIPVERAASSLASSNGGLLRSLVQDWQLSQYKRDFMSPALAKSAEKLKRDWFPRIERLVEAQLSGSGVDSVRMDFSAPIDFKLFIDDLRLYVRELDREHEISHVGSGTQSLVVAAIHSAVARLRGVSLILGFEEPEINLHPHAQLQLLNRLATSREQLLFTTHSSVLLDSLRHEEVVLCRRVDHRRGFATVGRQISGNFFSTHGLDKAKYYKFFRRANSEFMFADFVLVVEGPGDRLVFQHALNLHGFDFAARHVHVLDLGGKGSLPYVFFLLKALDIPFLSVVDRDFLSGYKNGTKKSSRTPSGIPLYSAKLESNLVIDEIAPSTAARVALTSLLQATTHALNGWLAQKGIYTLSTNLEVELVRCVKGGAIARSLVGLSPSAPLSDLLVKRPEAIKNEEFLGRVVGAMRYRELPLDFRRLANLVKVLVKD